MTKPNCYKCPHRGKVPGSAHSDCRHPQAITALADMFAGEPPALEVRLNPHGVSKGWANWPVDFDPIWIEACSGMPAEAPAAHILPEDVAA